MISGFTWASRHFFFFLARVADTSALCNITIVNTPVFLVMLPQVFSISAVFEDPVLAFTGQMDTSSSDSSSFQCQPFSNTRSQSRVAMSSTINSDLQSISEWGTHNLVKFNTSKTQLLTISLSNTPSNFQSSLKIAKFHLLILSIFFLGTSNIL